MKKEIIGWYCEGCDGTSAIFDTKENAKKKHFNNIPEQYIDYFLRDFQNKKIKITVDVLED